MSLYIDQYHRFFKRRSSVQFIKSLNFSIVCYKGNFRSHFQFFQLTPLRGCKKLPFSEVGEH